MKKINVRPQVLGKEIKMVKKMSKTPQPLCGARTRNGYTCQNWAMPNGRCRMHGGKSTGPRTPEGRERIRQANWRHGKRSAQAIKEHKDVKRWLKEAKQLVQEIDEENIPDKLKNQLEKLNDIEDKLINSVNFKYLTFRDRLAIAKYLREKLKGMLD